MISHLLNLLLPPSCFGCRASLSRPGLCTACRRSVCVLDALTCPICQRRSPSMVPICHPRAPYVLAAVSLYQPPLSAVIKALKYRRAKTTIALLTELVTEYFTTLEADFSEFTVTAIPLHSSRRRQRGFNQAQLIASIVAARLNLPLVQLLDRTRATASQAQLSERAMRRENISGAFEARPDLVTGKNIMLVDDVFTTGATMSEAVRTLRRAGAKKIVGFVICKTRL